MRDVGKLGEKQFEKWAGEVGVVTNPSIEDKKGWDFFIELPDYLQEDYHLTKYPQPIKSLVQVKSKDVKKDRISIKLSNWRQLIQNDYPTFIVIFEFLGKNDPQNVYVIHVWEELIKRYYKRIDALEPSTSLNESEMTVSYGEDELIDSCESLTLFKSFVEHVTPDFQEYSINKTKLINEHGNAELDFNFTIDFTLPDGYDDGEEYLVDFALGIVDKIKFDDLRVHDDEIAKKKIWEEFEHISMSPESIGKCEYKLRTTDYADEILLELDAYLPTAVSHVVSKEKLKLLFQGNFFYITTYIYRPDFSFRFQFKDVKSKFSLIRAEQACKLIEFIKHAQDQNKTVRSEITIADNHKTGGKVELLSTLDPDILSLFQLLTHTLNVSEFFGIKEKVKVSIEELLKSKKLLGLVNSIIDPDDDKLFELKGMWAKEEFPNDISTATPIAVNLKLGDYYLYLGALIIGNPQKERVEDGKIYYNTETEKVNVLRSSVRKKEFPDKIKDDLEEQLIEHVEDQDGLVLVQMEEN